MPSPASGIGEWDADAQLRALIRIQGNIEERDAPWWYFGRIYGIVPGQAPLPLVRFEGLEIMRFSPVDGGAFTANGVTTSYFQDLRSKAVLTEFDNPYTRRTVKVTPNQLGGTSQPGYHYSVEGVRPMAIAADAWDEDLHIVWDRYGDQIWLSHDRTYPPGLPQPLGEASFMRASVREVLDWDLSAVPASFSSTFISPWPVWMDMAGHEGHVMWHAEGVKLPDIDALPGPFYARMARDFPDRLRVKT